MSGAISRADLRTLRLGPLWVFSALVGRHRDFDPLEVDALWRSIDEVAAHTTGLAHEVLWLVEADQSRVLQDYAEEGRAIATGLRDVVTVLTQYDAGTSAEFLAALMAVGEGVGRARGPFGQRISQDDRDTLTLVAEILELDLADSDPVGIPR
jgi:hypothetical protein